MHSFFDVVHQVKADEIDSQGHVHNLQYLAWTLRAASRHSAAIGWDSAKMQDDLNCGWVVRSHEIQYRLAALVNDEILIRTWISDMARHVATRRTLICRPSDQKLLAKVSTRWVMADLRLRRAIPIPESIHSKITVLDSAPLPTW